MGNDIPLKGPSSRRELGDEQLSHLTSFLVMEATEKVEESLETFLVNDNRGCGIDNMVAVRFLSLVVACSVLSVCTLWRWPR